MLYQAHSPVLFLVFNRPETTAGVFAKIREARPPRLYIAADGPRVSKDGETERCCDTRKIATAVDWPCQVKTLFRETNLGCKNAVSSAIDWFFSQEEEGIILEDDCMPSNEFFRFCDAMLEKYRHDLRIRHITGSNVQHGRKHGEASYYFSRLTEIWGWASWRRAWRDYDKNLTNIKPSEVNALLTNQYNDALVGRVWKEVVIRMQQGKVDTWDYQLSVCNFINKGLSIIPNVNLITNTGFGDGATHTHNTTDINANKPAQELGVIVHPDAVLPSDEADLYTLNINFGLDRLRRKHRSLRYRLKLWFLGLFSSSD